MNLIKRVIILALVLGGGEPYKAATNGDNSDENGIVDEMEHLTEKVTALLENYAENLVNASAEGLAGLVTDDVISMFYGIPPTFGKENFTVFYKRMFERRVFARLEYTLDGFGEVDDVVYAWGQGRRYNTTEANAEPVNKAKYEFVLKRHKDGNLRIWLETKFLE